MTILQSAVQDEPDAPLALPLSHSSPWLASTTPSPQQSGSVHVAVQPPLAQARV
jgi:hypothetical protein